MLVCTRALTFLCLLAACYARFAIHQLGYLKLPLTVNPSETYKLASGSAEEASYDKDDNLIYVIGEGSHLLHVVDIRNPASPQRLYTHHFDPADGVPRDVEVCDGEVVIAMSADIPVFPGHVYFFQTYKRGSNTLVFDGKVTVGEFPDNLKFSPNCRILVVANEGRSGLDHAQRYMDPEGSITVIHKNDHGNPSETFIDFNKFNSRHDIRVVAHAIPHNLLSTHTSVAQGLEPEYVTMPDDNTAYVTFQENNAIAKINLKDHDVDEIFNMPAKEYRNYPMDASDKDGGIHMRSYPIKGLRGPDTIKSVVINRKPYLFVADEGFRSTFTQASHKFVWSDGERARTVLSRKMYDTDSINNPTLMSDINMDSHLGHLYVSQIDGLSAFTGKLEDVYTYGGRGFSIWEPGTHNLLWESGDELERRSRDSYYNVFNTDTYSPTTYSPETLRDTVSDDYGPKPNALDVISDKGQVFVVVGSESTGIIYLYNVSITGSRTPVVDVDFQDVYRRGSTDTIYQEMYTAKQIDAVGDMGISDIGFIHAKDSPSNRTMFYVLGAASGSLSLYDIQDLGPDIQLNP